MAPTCSRTILSSASSRRQRSDGAGGGSQGGGIVASTGLAARLQERTAALHRQAERSGFIKDMLKGRASRDGYALFLFNLLPAYRFLEGGLERHRGDARLAGLAASEVYRTRAIELDLAGLHAEGARLPARLPAGMAYAARVAAADVPRLIAHAYVRYLGDLSGGRILGRLLARSPGLGAAALGFYACPVIADPERFRDGYRQAIDAVPLDAREQAMVLDEACAAFGHNVRLSMQVASMQRGLGEGGQLGP